MQQQRVVRVDKIERRATVVNSRRCRRRRGRGGRRVTQGVYVRVLIVVVRG